MVHHVFRQLVSGYNDDDDYYSFFGSNRCLLVLTISVVSLLYKTKLSKLRLYELCLGGGRSTLFDHINKTQWTTDDDWW